VLFLTSAKTTWLRENPNKRKKNFTAQLGPVFGGAEQSREQGRNNTWTNLNWARVSAQVTGDRSAARGCSQSLISSRIMRCLYHLVHCGFRIYTGWLLTSVLVTYPCPIISHFNFAAVLNLKSVDEKEVDNLKNLTLYFRKVTFRISN